MEGGREGRDGGREGGEGERKEREVVHNTRLFLS